jgi:hypothetical protein
MTIEIHQPELEALIEQRMASGRYATIEDALLAALQTPPAPEAERTQKSLGQFLRESPLWGSGIEFERSKDQPGIIEF